RAWRDPPRVSDLFEIDPLDDGQALEMTAQAIEAHLDRAQAHPVSSTDDAAAPRGDVAIGGDGQTDGPAELDPVRAVVEIDQDRQRMRRPRLPPRRARHDLRRFAGDLTRSRRGVEADRRAYLGEFARHEAAANDLLAAREVGDARGDLAARECLHGGERAVPRRQRAQDNALQRLLVFGQDEVAEPLPHFALDRLELLPDVVEIGSAHRQLGLELRIVSAEAELHAAVGHERIHPREERVDVRLAEAVRVEALEMDHRLQSALGQEPRDDLLLEHALELARHAGREEEAGSADVEREAARGADRIVDHL